MTIEQVSKERAKELGMEIRTKANGPNDIWVELAFKPEGKFKDFSHVSLEIREGKKLLVGYAALREKRSSSGSVVVTFVANRAFLDKITLRVVVADVPLGGSGYELRVKDFVELVKPSPNAPPPGAVTNLVPLKLGSSIPLAVQSPGVAWKGNTFQLVRLNSIRFDLAKNDVLNADIQAGLTEFDDVDYDVSGAVFDAAGQMLGTARAQ